MKSIYKTGERTSLLDYAVTSYPTGEPERSAALRELRHLFHQLGLPMPQKNEYHPAHSRFGTALVFLAPYGCTLRICTRSYFEDCIRTTPEHPLILSHWHVIWGNI